MKKIYADMCGDLFHWGHVEFLKVARSLGDYLIVGVLSDSTVSRYKRLPVMTMAERVTVISACRFVDEVLPDAPFVVTSEFMKSLDISLVVHGSDLSNQTIERVYGDPLREGKLRVIGYTDGVSTSNIIERIRRMKSRRDDFRSVGRD